MAHSTPASIRHLPRLRAALASALCAVALGALAVLGAGCTPTAEGTIEIHVPDYFHRGSDRYDRTIPSPGHGAYLARLEFERQAGSRAMVLIRIEALVMTYLEAVSDLRCRNLDGSRYRCVGTADGPGGQVPIRFVSLINGSRIEGFQIWEMRPSAYDVEEGRALATRGPRLVASLGEGAGFVPAW